MRVPSTALGLLLVLNSINGKNLGYEYNRLATAFYLMMKAANL